MHALSVIRAIAPVGAGAPTDNATGAGAPTDNEIGAICESLPEPRGRLMLHP
jgi:hypothetical protein